MNRAGHLRLAAENGIALASAPRREMPFVRCRVCRSDFISYGQWSRHECDPGRPAERLMVAVCCLGLAVIAVAAALANRI